MYVLTGPSCQSCHRSTLSINASHSNSNYCETKNQDKIPSFSFFQFEFAIAGRKITLKCL